MDTGIKTPKVSVMMPVYNGERYIADAIYSILNQTFGDFELLILNDGSTDNTMQVVRSFSDSRVRVIENETNLGTIITRNRGLKLCRGEYIAMLDSDDLAEPTRFAKQVSFLDKHLDFGIVGSWVNLIDSNSRPLGASWRIAFRPEEAPVLLLFRTCFSFSAVMLRRAALPEDGFRLGYIPVEDYEIWIRILDKWKGYNLPELLTSYRIHSDSLSKKQSALQSEVVEKIHRSQLSKLGINPTPEELAIHRTSDTYRGQNTLQFIADRERWLLHLIESNKRTAAYDEKVFARVMTMVWLKSCKANTAPGLQVWMKFWRSPLGREVRLRDWKEVSKFFLKCLLKKDDR